MKTLYSILYFLMYSIVFALSIGVFVYFLPFSYVDNDHSYVRCLTDGVSYETSPNLIFLVDTKLDNFNDTKARKLCEHHVIRDYNETYDTPDEVNYTLEPAEKKSSSLPNALFAFGLVFFLGCRIVEYGFQRFSKKPGRYRKLLFGVIDDLIS